MSDNLSSREAVSDQSRSVSEKPPSDPTEPKIREKSLASLVAVIAIVGLVCCLFIHFTTIIIDWTRTKDFIEALKNLAEVAALVIGGFWAYYKFFKGRTYKESLNLVVTGQLRAIEGRAYLTATAYIKNVGLSNVKINKRGSGLRVFIYKPEADEKEIHTVFDEPLTTFGVFENDEYIEPNESIENQRLVAIPDGLKIGLRLELYIQSREGYTWNSSGIVFWEPAGKDKKSS
ncbi:MAG: hypothetical protein QOF62_3831 [Pyrinomonadaceae bacterium]|jgi:hypothetical protein|nr:hypothetical protein [Pyrinomonadaceae bacterium]